MVLGHTIRMTDWAPRARALSPSCPERVCFVSRFCPSCSVLVEVMRASQPPAVRSRMLTATRPQKDAASARPGPAGNQNRELESRSARVPPSSRPRPRCTVYAAATRRTANQAKSQRYTHTSRVPRPLSPSGGN
jgi:hypothetical protein